MNVNAVGERYKRELEVEVEFDGAQLLSEIEPLISDYFAADVRLLKEGLELSFANGQTFILSAERKV